MRWLKILGAIILLLSLSLGAACFFLGKRLPESKPGQPAQDLAARIEDAVQLKAWYQIPAITWNFRDRNVHLWDKQRGLNKVSYGKEKDRTEVLIFIYSQKGIAFHNGERMPADKEAEAVKDAYSRWANDSFWLNPVTKLRDKGVTLSVADDDPNALIVAFSSGGVTPGDTYRFHVGEDGKPTAVDMWVSILPVKGATASWKDWKQLEGGAWVGGDHRFNFGVSVNLTEIKTAKSAADLNGGKDPFAPLLEAFPTSQPAQSAPAPAETPDSSPAAIQ